MNFWFRPHYNVPVGYEPEVANVIERFVKPGHLCIDAGASVGFFTCLFSELVGPSGLVIAFEPNRESFRHLKRNINKRGLNNVKAYHNALWKCDLPELRLFSVEEIGYTSICHYARAAYTEVVEARALDSLLPPNEHPNFLKIDCEMSELEILYGAEKTLKAGVDCVVLEFNFHLMVQNGLSDREIRDYMAELGYDMFLINIKGDDRGFSYPIKVDRATKIVLQPGEIMHLNVMFSTDEKVRDRWKT
jgi:FkbM family methyltransferase